MDDRSFLLRVHLCSGIGNKGEAKIYRFMQQNKRQPQLKELRELLSETKTNLPQFLEDFHSNKITRKIKYNQTNSNILTILDPEYPQQLKEMFEPPLVLFYQGKVELFTKTEPGCCRSKKNVQLLRFCTSTTAKRYLRATDPHCKRCSSGS